jgi:predicted GIY-YIG superfamily endonuclease
MELNPSSGHATNLRDHLVKAKDPCGLATPRVYQIPCECGNVYLGETGRTIATRIKEHLRHLKLCQPEKSAVAEHSISENHANQWEDVKVISREKKYWERITKEATTNNNISRDGGCSLSNAGKPVLRRIRLAEDQSDGTWGPSAAIKSGHFRATTFTPDDGVRLVVRNVGSHGGSYPVGHPSSLHYQHTPGKHQIFLLSFLNRDVSPFPKAFFPNALSPKYFLPNTSFPIVKK